MAWTRKGVTYVVAPDSRYELDGDLLIDLPVSGEPMDGFRCVDFVAAAEIARTTDGRVVSIFQETKTLHGGYFHRLLWQEVRDE